MTFPHYALSGAVARDGDAALRLSDLQGQPSCSISGPASARPAAPRCRSSRVSPGEYAGRVLVIGVDLGQFFSLGSQEDAQRLLAELSITYPAGYTDDGAVVRELAVTGLPATLFINADGSLHRKWVGVLDEAKLPPKSPMRC